MKDLKAAVAVFCTACICAEVLIQLTQQTRARRCIKAVAGLYIIAALLRAVPGLATQSASVELPGGTQADFGSFAQNVLEQTAQSLEETLQNTIRAETGCSVRLQIKLQQTQTGVAAAAVQVAAKEPAEESNRGLALSPEQRAEIETLLRGQLGAVAISFAGEEGAT
jgi:hypothetical protein